jgi:hypothetical protein
MPRRNRPKLSRNMRRRRHRGRKRDRKRATPRPPVFPHQGPPGHPLLPVFSLTVRQPAKALHTTSHKRA